MSWGNPTTGRERLLAAALKPASIAYGVGAYCRLKAYASGLPRHQFTVPVISVGNITCGGTGKTPVAIKIARDMLSAGYKVAILSRGYKRKDENALTVVSDAAGHLSQPEDSGDEPFLMARSLPEAVVIASSSRKLAGQMAIEKMGCNLLVLDDAFQHLAVRRDLDLVLIDYSDEPQNDALLPAGRLREPLSSLGRASAVIITKVPEHADPDKLQRLKSLIGRFVQSSSIYSCRFAARSLISEDRQLMPIELLKESEILAFCGLARPESFFKQLQLIGAKTARKLAFPDHHWYSQTDLKKLESAAHASKSGLLITTEKDLVKLNLPNSLKDRVYALRLETEWVGDAPDFVSLLSHTQSLPAGSKEPMPT